MNNEELKKLVHFDEDCRDEVMRAGIKFLQLADKYEERGLTSCDLYQDLLWLDTLCQKVSGRSCSHITRLAGEEG